MPDSPTCHIVTGSLTREGEVAYLRADGTWASTLAESHPFKDRAQADARLAEVKVHEDVISEAYVFEAELSGDEIRPISAREILRANGPSTRLRRPDPAGAHPS